MDVDNLLFQEMNRNTAAIMGLLEGYVADKDLATVSKRIGDILHNSRRRIAEILEGNDGKTIGRSAVSES